MTVRDAFLFFSLYVPGVDPDHDDPDDVVENLVAKLNEGRAHNERIEVSLIPSPQWLTPATLANLRAAAKGGGT